jgi:hypothetical protein
VGNTLACVEINGPAGVGDIETSLSAIAELLASEIKRIEVPA